MDQPVSQQSTRHQAHAEEASDAAVMNAVALPCN